MCGLGSLERWRTSGGTPSTTQVKKKYRGVRRDPSHSSAQGKMEYVWIGEFGEMKNFRWNSLNSSGKGKREYVWIGEFRDFSRNSLK
jgi:hypothetical protein